MASRMAWGVCVGDTGGGRGRRIPSGLRIAVRWALGARHGGGVICDSAVVPVWEGGCARGRVCTIDGEMEVEVEVEVEVEDGSGRRKMEDGRRKTEDGRESGRVGG